MTASDVPITSLLAELGYESPEATAAARTAIERAGLTNPRKTNISGAKRPLVAEALSAALVRCCGANRCVGLLASDHRAMVRVPANLCEVCGGSRNTAAARELSEAAVRSTVRSVLVVGGSPSTRREAERLIAAAGLVVTAVDGTVVPANGWADSMLDSHDVVIIWASTQLPHKVSRQFHKAAYRRKTITVGQRGVAAVLHALSVHLELRSQTA